MPITVALDRSPEDARPWIEAARPTHPSLIDSGHVLAELYHVVNVPTLIWIDEAGRIVRPNDNQFGTDTFTRPADCGSFSMADTRPTTSPSCVKLDRGSATGGAPRAVGSRSPATKLVWKPAGR